MKLPGDELPAELRSKIQSQVVSLLSDQFPSSFGGNIPLACHNVGKSIDLLDSIRNCSAESLICLYEPSPYDIRTFTKKSALEYFAHRKPWEDYDLILLSDSFDWGVSLSHNDRVQQLVG